MAGVITIDDLFEEVVGEIEESSTAAAIRVDPTGQLCVAVERIYVHRAVAGPFLAALTRAAAT